MTQPRSSQVAIDQTSFYHCYVRCVRRAFLCGEDYSTGQNYDYRKQWIVSRLKFLSYVYAIDICAYAVMSNHYHVVLHVDKDRADSWSYEEVAERWMQLYKGHSLVDQWLTDPDAVSHAVWLEVKKILEDWRERLYDISWFMRGVNETIARMANQEEGCKGRFWEGRFRSQALLDEVALLSCMAYVDLNPIRADMAKDLVESNFTSIQQRLRDYAVRKQNKTASESKVIKKVEQHTALKEELGLAKQPEAKLMTFDGSSRTSIHAALPFTRTDYFDLVDTTGRIIREDKAGFIPSEIPPILDRFGIQPDHWIKHVKHFQRRYGRAAGAADKLKFYAKSISGLVTAGKWCRGVSCSREIYS